MVRCVRGEEEDGVMSEEGKRSALSPAPPPISPWQLEQGGQEPAEGGRGKY